MSTDLASLGIKVDTTDVNRAKTDLQGFGNAADETSVKVERLGKRAEQSMQNAAAIGTAVGNFITDMAGRLASMVGSVLSLGDELYTMSQRIGVSVETLSKLKYVGEQTGVGFDELVSAMSRFSRTVQQAADGGKASSEIFKRLQIDIGALKAMKPEEAFFAIIDRLAQLPDQYQKAAAAQELFGRGFQTIMPLINEGSEAIRELMKEAEDLGIVMSTKTAKDSDALKDTMNSLSSATKGLFIQAIAPLLPALIELSTRLLESKKEGQTGWVERLTGAFKLLGEVVLLTGGALKYVGTAMAGIFAAINQGTERMSFTVAFDVLKDSAADLRRILVETKKDMSALWDGSMGADKAAKVAAIMDKIKRSMDDVDEKAKRAKTTRDPYADAIQNLERQAALLGKTSGLEKMLWEVESGRFKDFSVEQKAVLVGLQEAVDLREYEQRAIDDAAKAAADYWREAERANDAQAKRVAKMQDEAKEAQRNVQLIGKTKEQVDLLKAEWMAESIAQAEATLQAALYGHEADADVQAIRDMIQVLKDKRQAMLDASAAEGEAERVKDITKEQEKAAKATEKMIDDMADKAANFIEDFAHNGSKAFKNLWNDFVSWGLKALAQIAARQVIVSLGGVAAAGGSGSAFGGTGGMGSSIGSMGQNYAASYAYDSAMGVYGAYMAATTPAATTAAMGSASLATSMYGGAAAEIVGGAALAADGTVVGAGMYAGLEAGLAAIPVVGWVALAAAIVYGIVQGMEEGPAERLADFVSGAAAKSGNQKFASSSQFGDFGFVNDKWFSDDSGFVKAIDSINTAVKGLDNAIAGLVGDDMSKTIADALAAHTQSVSMGSEDANLDQVAALSGAQILMDRYTVVLDTINGSLDDLLKGFSGTGAELATFVQDIVGVYEALKNDNVAEMFGDVTVEAFNALRNEGETLGAAFNRLVGEFQLTTLAADLIGGSFGEAGLASSVAREQLIKFAGGASALAQNLQTFDQAFYTDAERLARTQDAVTEAMDALNLALPESRDGFRDLVEGLDLATESGRQTYASLLSLAGAADAIYDAAEAAKASIRTGDARGSDQNNYAELATAAATGAGEISKALADSQAALAAWDSRDLGSYLGGWNAADVPQKSAAAATVDWSSQIAQKQIELLTAQGKQLEALNLQRERELASLSDAPAGLRDLVTQLYGLQEESIKSAAAAKAAAEARAALIDATQDEIAAYKTTIDAFLKPLGDLDRAMQDINPPALALVDLWRQTKDEMEGLASALADLDGSRAQTAIERLSATMSQLSQFGDIRSGIASSIIDLKASKGDASAVALLKAQESSLTSQLATATDKGAIAQALTAAVIRRIKIEGALEQKAINDKWVAEQDALKDQIALAREARQVEIDALQERIAGVERLREAAAGIKDYLTSLRAGSLSPLGYTERLGESRSLFESTLRDAMSGNGDALGNLRSNAQDYLGQAQQYYGGATSGYGSVFASVTAALEQFGLTAGSADVGGLKAQLDVLQSIDDAIEQQTAEQVDTTDRQIAAYEALDATFANVEVGLKSSAAEQTAALKEQIAELGKVVANQEAQITQAAAAYTAMLERLAEMNKKLDDINADGSLATAAR